jgi:dolichol-phosphate mannosyltransferase
MRKKLAVVIPTFNERENVPILVERLTELLGSINYELIIVDDNSADGTWKIAEELAAGMREVRCLRRIGRNGLSSAVIEGVLSTTAEFVCVIDADLQHDEKMIPVMFEKASNEADLVIGTRYVDGGSVSNWSKKRLRISQIATKFTQTLFKHNLSDPMSGFFLIKREYFNKVIENLDGKGFKILLDIISNYSPEDLKIAEVPYIFGVRKHGESKLNMGIVMSFLEFLYIKKIGNLVPLRFVKFSMVGSMGAVIHFSVLYFLFKVNQMSYGVSILFAIESAVIFSFALNNRWTFKDNILTGIQKIIFGFVKYNMACFVGGVLSYFISMNLMQNNYHWVGASIIGAITAVLWNYNLNRIFTWHITNSQ